MKKTVPFLFAAALLVFAVSGAEPAATNAARPVANSTAGNPAVFPRFPSPRLANFQNPMYQTIRDL